MFVVVGLGNPGTKYIGTRHNVGFTMLSIVSDSFGIQFESKTKFFSEIASITTNSDKLILCKPQTFMNNSGKAILSIMSFYKLQPSSILVMHDELDISLGSAKYKMGGRSSGHNGLRSISQCIGPNYHRIRIGIGRPKNKQLSIADFVLSKFNSEEDLIVSRVLELINSALPLFYKGDFKNLQQNLNLIKPNDISID